MALGAFQCIMSDNYQRLSCATNISHVSRLSNLAKHIARPLSFNGSIWLKNPEDFVLQFDIVLANEVSQIETFDTPDYTRTRSQKKQLVYLVSLAAMFSPLSSNIYFPALPAISKALNTPVALVALSIAIYMLFQGLAPSFWGPLADALGRRPVLVATLLVYLAANIALSLPGQWFKPRIQLLLLT
jgi:hypothetical protein